jgi:hypothetical protein
MELNPPNQDPIKIIQGFLQKDPDGATLTDDQICTPFEHFKETVF